MLQAAADHQVHTPSAAIAPQPAPTYLAQIWQSRPRSTLTTFLEFHSHRGRGMNPEEGPASLPTSACCCALPRSGSARLFPVTFWCGARSQPTHRSVASKMEVPVVCGNLTLTLTLTYRELHQRMGLHDGNARHQRRQRRQWLGCGRSFRRCQVPPREWTSSALGMPHRLLPHVSMRLGLPGQRARCVGLVSSRSLYCCCSNATTCRYQ